MNSRLSKLKMLLGISGEDKDELLGFLIDSSEVLILGYCRIEYIPPQLENIVAEIAADMYRSKGYGSETAPQEVVSMTQGKRSVSFNNRTMSDDEILSNYYKRLKPFKNRKGRVPSDVQTV